MTEAGLAVSPEMASIIPSVDGSLPAPDYLGSLSVANILGVPKDAVEGLQFDTAHAFSVDADQQTLELRFEGEPIQAERFLSLLEATAPKPSPFGRGYSDRKAEDILDDWIIYEGDNPNYEHLLEAHSGLSGWTQLGKEYPDLKASLMPLENFRLVPWMMPGEEKILAPETHIPNWGWADKLAEFKPIISSPDFVQLLNDVYGVKEARTRVVTAIRNAYIDKVLEEEIGIDIESAKDDELFQIFLSLGVEQRNQLVSVHDIQGEYRGDGNHGWSRNEQTEKFTELYLERHCVTFETEDRVLMYAHGIEPGFDIDQAYAERRRVYYDSSRESRHVHDRGMAYEYELMDVDTILGKKTVIIPGSVKFQELGLIPTVRWSVGTDGKRKPQALPEHGTFTSYREKVLSGVTGMMVLAYLQPQRRKHWKQEARLPGIERTQDMGPAQAPLIALQQSTRLLDNDLVREAEALAQA